MPVRCRIMKTLLHLFAVAGNTDLFGVRPGWQVWPFSLSRMPYRSVARYEKPFRTVQSAFLVFVVGGSRCRTYGFGCAAADVF